MPEALEVVLRTLFAVVVMFFLTKILGKRQVSQLSFLNILRELQWGAWLLISRWTRIRPGIWA